MNAIKGGAWDVGDVGLPMDRSGSFGYDLLDSKTRVIPFGKFMRNYLDVDTLRMD